MIRYMAALFGLCLEFVAAGSLADPLGTEFRVNRITEGGQSEASAAGTANGGFVVVWSDLRGIFGQRFLSNGKRTERQFRVSDFRADRIHEFPQVASLDRQGFVVVWDSDVADDFNYDIYAQRFDAVGERIGDRFRVNTSTAGDQRAPSIAELDGGGFVVVWPGQSLVNRTGDIFAQLYSATGVPVGGEVRVNADPSKEQYDPAVAALRGGGFLVVWTAPFNRFGRFAVHGQRFDEDGTAIGDEFEVDHSAGNGGPSPVVAGLPGGGFVVGWEEFRSSRYSAMLQLYAADARPIGEAFPASLLPEGHQFDLAVAALQDGGFAVAWQETPDDFKRSVIRGRRFAGDGGPIGEAFRIDGSAERFDFLPSLAAFDTDRFVAVWTGGNGSGVHSDIYGQLFKATK